jgi:DMSO/TMAO reductase YedYZ heme-binding membrane subunit
VATAPPITGPKTILHTRGTWSSRDDRAPSAVWIAILWAGMLAGFGLDFPKYLHQKPSPSTVLHVHAAVFTVWMLLLTAQILLVLGDRVSLHRKLGVFAAGWAGLMAIMGPWAAMEWQVLKLHTPRSNPWFLSLNIVDIAGFLILLAWGFRSARTPQPTAG